MEGAEPGDTLEVRIQKIDLAVPYATNGFSPQRGVLPTEYSAGPHQADPSRQGTHGGQLRAGHRDPAAPFFGSMGVAPAE